MFSRIQTIFDAFKTNWSTDPAARGAAKMALGAAFLAEGIFGVARGSRNGTSLVGGLVIGIGAAVFIVIGVAMSPDKYADAVKLKGQISQVISVRESDGKHAYSSVYSYDVDGKTYTLSSSVTGSKRPNIGSPVDIVYSAAEPRNAYREDGMEGWFSWVFLGSGIFLAFWAATALIVSLALTVAGFMLFRSGRKDRAGAVESSGFFRDLISLVTTTRKAE